MYERRSIDVKCSKSMWEIRNILINIIESFKVTWLIIILCSGYTGVPCSHSRCHGFNAKFNLLMTNKEFFKPLLKGAPDQYQPELDEMFVKLNNLTINAKDVKNILTEIDNRDHGNENDQTNKHTVYKISQKKTQRSGG